jgi:D-threo-aldose 1-dehydrogenase
MRAFEDSLQRLGLPRVDLLLIHDLDLWHHQRIERVTAYLTELFNGGWRALQELKQAGLIRGIGAGINELGMMPRMLDLMDLDFFLVALRYTLLDQRVLDHEFPRCVSHKLGFVIGGVFASGILATGAVEGAKNDYADASPEVMATVARIEAATTCRCPPPPCNSRSAMPRSPPSSLARSRPNRSGATSPHSATRSRRRCGTN